MTCQVNFLAGPGHVDEIMQQDDLLVARQPACRHRARALLQRQLLVVAVDCLHLIDLPPHHMGVRGSFMQRLLCSCFVPGPSIAR